MTTEEKEELIQSLLAEKDAAEADSDESGGGFSVKQQVESVPPLPSNNKFSILPIQLINNDPPKPDTEHKDTLKASTRLARWPKWERKLPPRPVIASLDPKGTSLMLWVELETTDTAGRKNVQALVDCGATGSFIDRDFVRESKLNTRQLSRPIPVYNVDGSANEAGQISEVVDILLRYKNHSERSLLAVTGLGRQKLLLGYTWLKEHNPEIDWQTGEVKMSHCPRKCTECQTEANAENKANKLKAQCICTCQTGPYPVLVEDMDDSDEVCRSPDEASRLDSLEDGDRIFATGLLPPSEHVRASATTSQRLAEAFHCNSQPSEPPPAGFQQHLPPHLQDYEEVFSKESFDILPDHRQWDHVS